MITAPAVVTPQGVIYYQNFDVVFSNIKSVCWDRERRLLESLRKVLAAVVHELCLIHLCPEDMQYFSLLPSVKTNFNYASFLIR